MLLRLQMFQYRVDLTLEHLQLLECHVFLVRIQSIDVQWILERNELSIAKINIQGCASSLSSGRVARRTSSSLFGFGDSGNQSSFIGRFDGRSILGADVSSKGKEY